MARPSERARGKRVVFDEETWRALDLLMHEQMKSFDEISAEAFRDLLRKYGQPENLKAALKESARGAHQRSTKTPNPGEKQTKRKRR